MKNGLIFNEPVGRWESEIKMCFSHFILLAKINLVIFLVCFIAKRTKQIKR